MRGQQMEMASVDNSWDTSSKRKTGKGHQVSERWLNHRNKKQRRICHLTIICLFICLFVYRRGHWDSEKLSLPSSQWVGKKDLNPCPFRATQKEAQYKTFWKLRGAHSQLPESGVWVLDILSALLTHTLSFSKGTEGLRMNTPWWQTHLLFL